MTLLQVPGGPELLIIGLVFAFLVAITMAVVALIVFFSRRNRSQPSVDERRIDELEERVEELETDREG